MLTTTDIHSDTVQQAPVTDTDTTSSSAHVTSPSRDVIDLRHTPRCDTDTLPIQSASQQSVSLSVSLRVSVCVVLSVAVNVNSATHFVTMKLSWTHDLQGTEARFLALCTQRQIQN